MFSSVLLPGYGRVRDEIVCFCFMTLSPSRLVLVRFLVPGSVASEPFGVFCNLKRFHSCPLSKIGPSRLLRGLIITAVITVDCPIEGCHMDSDGTISTEASPTFYFLLSFSLPSLFFRRTASWCLFVRCFSPELLPIAALLLPCSSKPVRAQTFPCCFSHLLLVSLEVMNYMRFVFVDSCASIWCI